jgi:hypothetical protein
MLSRYIPLALGGLLLCTAAALAQGDARAIVEKAIQAQGGPAKVAKLRVMRIKIEGRTDLVPNQPDLPITLEDTWQMPSQYKSESSLQVGGKKYTQVQVLDGDAGWIQMAGMVQEMPKEAVAEMKEQRFAEDLDRLGFLSDKAIELAGCEEAKVDGKPAACVLVKSRGHRDVKLYFDKTTGLLVKREHHVLDPMTNKEVRQEVIFSDYEEKDGLKHYKKIVLLRDGRKMIEARVMELEFFDKLDPKVFAKPGGGK